MKRIAAALLDLDGTLYSANARLVGRIDRNLTAFIADRLGLPHAEADALRLEYWREYGATVCGLYLEHGIPYEESYRIVCDFDFRDHVTPDPRVARALRALRCRRVLFSNALRAYIDRLLAALELEGLFSPIYSLEFSNYDAKPSPALYRRVLADLRLPAAQCVMVDDRAANLTPAGDLGMVTVLVGGEETCLVDHHIGHLAELPPLLEARYPVIPARAPRAGGQDCA